MNSFKYAVFIILIQAVFLEGCNSTGPARTNPTSDAEITRNAGEYTLGSGDQIRVIVFGEDDLSGEFLVDGSGAVSMPLVGEINAKGKTIRAFQRALELALKDGYLTDPKVSAEVLNFRPFYILGEVEVSGEYPYTEGLTLLNAIATAGGFTYRANTKTIYIKQAGATDETAYPLTASTPVLPGDTIRVAERFF